jgi:hypothetical protein
MILRGVSLEIVEQVLSAPEQVVPASNGNFAYQSRIVFGRKTFLVRVIVDERRNPPVVATVYRTSKIDKYWEEELT